MKYFLLILIFLSNFNVFSSNSDSFVRAELGFVNYLMQNNDYITALYQLNKLNDDNRFKDSIHYLKAICFFNQRVFDSSSIQFDLVSPFFISFHKSVFLSAISKVHLLKYDAAIEHLKKFEPADTLLGKLINLELAGIYLLKRNYDSFLICSGKFDYSWFVTIRQEKNLLDYYQVLKSQKKKSMFLAGLFSTFIPGSGKIYAGRTGSGISSFLSTVSLGLVAYENFRKDGILNYKTLFFSSLFATFYAGNIWGSVFSVKMESQNDNDEINNHILLDLHYPLHTYFN